MPTINDIVEEHQRRLDAHIVLINGIRTDTDIARAKAFEAVAEIAGTRVNVRSYTDERIQYVLDQLALRLTQLRESIITETSGYADGVGSQIVADVNTSLDQWQNAMEQEVAGALANYEVMSQWAEDTYDIEIPRINAEIEANTEEVRANFQDILNEANISRQETAEMATRWRGLADEIVDHRNAILEMDYSIYAVKDDLYRTISVEYDDRLASFDERITVAAGDAGAVADRVQTLEVQQGEQSAQVQTLERAMIDGNTQLAQQITSLSVGTNTQFDTFQIWHFDANVEGWTGTWVNGFLRVNDSTTSPALNVDASKYRQIRARIKKVGNPTWNANLQYMGATPDETILIPEPIWAGDLGEITINPSWSGVLTRLILTLNSGSTNADHYELDWITVGRPAPGASSADILAERQARTSGDSALGSRIDAINLRLNTGDGVYGVATDIVDGVKSEIIQDAVTGAVTATNESITAFDTRIDNLETGQTVTSSAVSALNNKVTVNEQAIQAVNSRVDNFTFDDDNLVQSDLFQALTQRVDIAEGNVTSLNQFITAMDTTISTVQGNVSAAQNAANAAASLAGSKGKVLVQNAEPAAADRLPVNLWIDTTGDANTPKRWNGSEWAAVTDKIARDAAAAAAAALAGLGDKANASAVTALTQRVAQTEQGLSSQSSNITQLGNNIELVGNNASNAASAAQNAMNLAGSKGKVIVQSAAPAVAERLPQNLWIDTTGNANTPKRWNGTAWVAVTDKVALDAAAAAQNALNAVALKADATAVQELSTRVEETENGLESAGRNFTRIDNSIEIVGDNAAAASQAAQAASNLAGGKGKVFFQNTAPAIAERLPQNLWIDTTSGNNTPKRWNGTVWAAVTDKVASDAKDAADAANRLAGTKADSSYVDDVNTKVNTQKDRIDAVGSRVERLETSVNNPANGILAMSNSINYVNSRVNTIGDTVTAQASSIQALTASVNGSTANTLFKADVISTPAGALARIALSARSKVGDESQVAAMFMTAGSNGVNEIQMVASRFSIVQGVNGEAFVPFVVAGGIVYINSAFIQNLSVGTLKLADNSVTVTWSANSNALSINSPYPAKLIVITNSTVEGTYSRHTTDYYLRRNGVVIDQSAFSVNEYTYPYTNITILNVPAGVSNFHFNYVRRGTGEATNFVSNRIAVFGAFK